jgi:hypothetical protein
MSIELFWSLLRHRHAVICGALAAVTPNELCAELHNRDAGGPGA